MRTSCCYKIAGTKTYRLSSTKILGKWGQNLQNLEKGMRQIYVPDEGKIFVQVDQSGAEALIVAYLSKAGRFRQLFENGIKPHVYVALRLFKDVWQPKMKEKRLITADSGFDIDEIIATPIPELKNHRHWKAVDSIIKDSDNWSLQERYYYLAKQTCHCVDGETEVLTKDGWLPVSTVSESLKAIGVFSKDGSIVFEVPAQWHISESSNYEMFSLRGDETDQLVTPNHTIVYESNNKLHKRPAKDVMSLKRPDIPVVGYLKSGSVNLPDWHVKFLVAVQADGYYYSESSVRFRFVKSRKIERLLSILKQSNLTYELRHTDVTEIYVREVEELLKCFRPEKVWGAWLLDLSQQNLNLLVTELKHWDGSLCESFHHKREKYTTAIKTNAEWVKTVCHLTGRQGTITFDGYMYEVGINNRKFSIAKWKKKVENYVGQLYCPTVSTGMFLIRRKGLISITGNSGNYGITPNTFRMNVLEKSGGKIVIGKDEAEYFILTYQSLFPEIFEWHQEVQRQVNATWMLYNLHGHPFQWTEYGVLESKWKELYAWVPQSTVGEITNIAFTRLQEHIEQHNLEWDLLANTHDSYLLQCPVGQEQEAAKIMKFYIEQKFKSPVDGVEFQMRSEAQSGFNWSPYKAEKNELGLKEIK